MSLTDLHEISFNDFPLIEPVQRALSDVGYETPSPIQAKIIPHVLAGRDVVGQAQTGTGKTAAFALPLLSRIDIKRKHPQVLVLAPTRELAIQVAEAFKRYASYIDQFHVLPIYGGQDYSGQLRQLKRGAQVIVGTPGRVMDHMRKGSLKLDQLSCLVLDEADEMLRMGFIDDVEWILEQTPSERQTALFSATIPPAIRRIAQSQLNDPIEITIKVKTTTADTVRQRYLVCQNAEKLDALTRILEAESFSAMIVFVRTKTATVELVEKLEARGYAAAALNGDIAQNQRERTVNRLKKGNLDILVATDVAARGLDVDRITHVVNYDIPYDNEAYVHRIGRTGRAGRTGDAILFVAPREKRLLHAIEKSTKQRIEQMQLPSSHVINDQRVARFKQRIADTLDKEDLSLYQKLVDDFQFEYNAPMSVVAAALARLVQGDEPFFISDKKRKSREKIEKKRRQAEGVDVGNTDKTKKNRRSKTVANDIEFELFRIEVGHVHNVKPGNIVGAIANEADIDSDYIGDIVIEEDHSLVQLPEGMPKSVFKHLRQVWVSGQQLKISRLSDSGFNEKETNRQKIKNKAKPQVKLKREKSSESRGEFKKKAKRDSAEKKSKKQDKKSKKAKKKSQA